MDNKWKLPKNLLIIPEEDDYKIQLKNISPLRYPGGKTRACKILDQIISEHFNISNFDTLLSPFFGGGSFEFFFQNKYNHQLCVNDKFTPLSNFWTQVKKDKTTLCAELRKIDVVSKDDFIKYRNSVILEKDILQQAKQYFILNRCSFSGATLSGGFSEEASVKRFTDNSIKKIEQLNLDNMEMYNYDFEYFLQEYSKASTLIFLDPPYFLEKKSKLYGKNGDLHENFDHDKLFQILKMKKNWILTYNNCEYIKTLYKDFTIFEVDWKYGMNKTKKSSEIVIVNNIGDI